MIPQEIIDQIKQAKADLAIARQEESLADPEHMDVAIEATNIAMDRLNNLIRKSKLYA